PQGIDNVGYFGTKGVETNANLPSPRYWMSSWTDLSGNFYLWGGSQDFENYDDVWRYNPNTNKWTWVAGGSSINGNGNYQQYCLNQSNGSPKARGSASVAQILGCSNNFLTFGGDQEYPGNGDNFFNDLWLFQTTTNQWTWLSGPSTHND